MASKNGHGHLRNIDLSDRELLHIMLDVADENGYAVSTHIAEQLGIRGAEKKSGKRSARGIVSARLAWMNRYGFVRRIPPEALRLPRTEESRWEVTEIGRELAAGRLTKALENSLTSIRPGQALLLMRQLGIASYVNAAPEMATAVRREWQHTAARRARL